MRKIENRCVNLLEGLLALSLLVMFLLVVTLVIARYVFNAAIPGANEAVTIIFIYTSSIGGALAAGRREHIAIPVLIDRLPGAARRWIDVLGLAAVAFINGVMVWFSFHWIGITGGYLMPSTGLPRIAAQLSIPIGCGLAAVYCAAVAVAKLREERSPE